MGLADYKEIVGKAASTASFGLLLAPSFLCFKIWRRGTSQDIPFLPLMEGMARSILIFQQGIIMEIRPLVVTHSIGILLNLFYITTYLFFTKDKSAVKKTIIRWSVFLLLMISYANYEDKSLVESRFGTLVTIFTISIMLYHLYGVKHVIEKKNTQDLPFPILLAASCVTFLWTLYGTIINKPALQLQTGFAFLVCAFELSLFAIYPSKPSEPKKQN